MKTTRPAPARTQSVILRAWQQQALQAFVADRSSSFLAVACPGAGKTSFALVAIRHWCAGQLRPIVVVVPTQHLKKQWADAALKFGFHLDPAWSTSEGKPAVDQHGVVVTYAQAASSADELARYCAGGIVVLDEVHHAASDRSWGDGVERAFSGAATRLLLSGTPFRTDDSPIPFVRYSWGDYGDAEADFDYGYGEALRDGGVVRPVYFPRFDGHMEWINAEGALIEATFEDDLAGSEWGARLRTALSPDGEWIRTVLDQAHAKLSTIRREHHPDAGGLIIATDHEHARAIGDLLERRHGVTAGIALSDDPRAGEVIDRFSTSDEEWVIAVRMISEGVDIPRLRVAVFATTTTTAMFFRQAVGRIARWTPGIRDQKAYMYLPDDLRLRSHAVMIAEQRRHSIELRRERAGDEGFDAITQDRGDDEQMSLFEALSSSVIDADSTGPGDGLDPSERMVVLPDDLEGFPVDLPPPPPLPGRDPIAVSDPWGSPVATCEPVRSRAAIKAELRDKNADRVREIVGRTGLGYPEVNMRLNRESGVDRINEATISGLTRRLSVADRWIASIRR